MEVWATCLERIGTGPDGWRRYLDDRPPETLSVQARLSLIQALVDGGSYETAAFERSQLPSTHGGEADELLFAAADPVVSLDAARRLVISSPSFLASSDRELDRRLASQLSPEQQLERAGAWRRAGRASRAASELRGKKWSGDLERRRRRELARSELDSGSPTRALNALPSGRNADPVDHALRSRAFRNRGWHLFPGRGEQRFFDDCVSAAEATITANTAGDTLTEAHVLRLECATQTGRLERALESWRALESEGWRDARRDWLGRRLGLALARTGEILAVQELGRSLPTHSRCLQYWVADASAESNTELAALAVTGIADLYALWSRQALALTSPQHLVLAAAVVPGVPPRSVERLLNAGSKSEALRQWRRIRRSRPPTPAEALAAAQHTADHGWSTDSIRWLRAGFPELGTVDMTRAPENVVRVYLPLPFKEEIEAAAAEARLDPWLLAGVARQESGFVAHARSPKGAIGILQLLPSTGRLHARALGLGSQPDLRDPAVNLRLGARELGFLVRRFGAIEPALAAYNGGLTRVRGWWKRWPDRRRFTEEIPVPETYNYVRRVVFLAEAYRLVYEDDWRSAR
jgi:soluble lytic murein transglycosylase